MAAAGTALAQEPVAQDVPRPGEPPPLTETPVLRPPTQLPSVQGPQGQAIQGIETLLDRVPADYLPLGIRAGSFLIFPQVTGAVAFDDNIFETRNNRRSDVIFAINPAVSAISTWSRHQVIAFADAQILRYVAKDDQDTEGFGVGASGRYDISQASTANGSFVFRRANESATDPAVANRTFPTQYDALDLRAGYTYDLTRLGFGFDANYTRYDFRQAIDRNRDRYEVRVAPVASYKFSPSLSAFVEPAYTLYRYDNLSDLQNFETIGSLFGVRFDLSGIFRGESSVGFLHQMSDNGALDDVTGVITRNSLIWAPTELTQVTGSLTRFDSPSTENGASTVFRTDATLNVQHDVLRNARLFVQGSYILDDFEGISRTDHIYDAQLGGQYIVNRNVSLFVNYEYTERDSDIGANSFSKNVFLFGVRGSL